MPRLAHCVAGGGVTHRHVMRALDMADLAADRADLAEDAAHRRRRLRWRVVAGGKRADLADDMADLADDGADGDWPPPQQPPFELWPPPPTPVDGPARAGDAIASAAIETRVMVFIFGPPSLGPARMRRSTRSRLASSASSALNSKVTSGLVAVAVAARAGANADGNTASGAVSITDAHASRVRGRHAEPDRNVAVRTVR